MIDDETNAGAGKQGGAGQLVDKPAAPALETAADSFLRVEYQETHRYFLQIESTMHDLMKFHILALVGLMSASIALAKFVLEAQTDLPLFGMLSALWGVFGAAGILLLYYYLELRIRKIVFVEQLAAIRAHYIEAAPELDSVLRLVKSVVASPKYLRRPSAEWYSMIFFSAANAGSFLFALYALNLELGYLDFDQPWYASTFVATGIVLFLIQFGSITLIAFANDLRREREVGASQYDLLPRGTAIVFLSMALTANVIEWAARRLQSWPRQANKRVP